ncbi:MFS transporter [Streptomyces vinaceus]|uniref:MFS transporter n=1 Tax=Streptomyces vinaceus TaxID=1960 RepID=UPI0035DA54E8
MGMFFDLYEIFLSGALATVLVKHFGLDTQELPYVLGSTFVGMFIGGLVFGRAADRIGRRTTILACLGLYSACSLAAAFSPSATILIVLRFVGGMGLGAELPISDAYLADLLPARHRGRGIARAFTAGFLGVPVAGFLAAWLAPTAPLGIDGWRWLFVIGAAGGASVLFLRRRLPESPRWLEAMGRHTEADRIVTGMEHEAGRHADSGVAQVPAPVPVPVPVAASHTSRACQLIGRDYRRRTVMMALTQLLQSVGYYGFGSLVPLILTAKGYPMTTSLLFSAMSFLGYPLGSLLSLPLMERCERKHLIAGSALSMAALGTGFGYAHSTVQVIVFGLGYTAVSNIFSNSLHTYQAEIFPTRLRATAASWTYGLSRLSTAAMPFVLIPILHGAGQGTVFAIIAVAMAVLCANILLLGPRTTGRDLRHVGLEPSP